MATALDLEQQPVSATDFNSPSAEIARQARLRKVQEQIIFDQHQKAEEQRQQAAALDQQRAQLQINKDQREEQAQTAAADAARWVPTADYQKPWDQQPQEFKQHFQNGYSAIADQIPNIVNKAVRTTTGNPAIGFENLPEGSEAVVETEPGVRVHVGNTKELQKLQKSLADVGGNPEGLSREELLQQIAARSESKMPAAVKQELMQGGVWKEGITPEEGYSKLMENGVMPSHLMKPAMQMASQIQHDPVLAPFTKQLSAYNTLKTGFEDPTGGGFSDMAMIEGFQRLINPGAIVRVQTMNQMLKAAGLSQYGSWDFLVKKLEQGDKLSPEARTRIMNLAEQEMAHAKRDVTKQLAGKRTLAKMMGVPNPKAFVDSVMTIAAENPEEAAAAESGQAAQPANGGVLTITTQEQYNALPSGARYQDSNGRVGVKK